MLVAVVLVGDSAQLAWLQSSPSPRSSLSFNQPNCAKISEANKFNIKESKGHGNQRTRFKHRRQLISDGMLAAMPFPALPKNEMGVFRLIIYVLGVD